MSGNRNDRAKSVSEKKWVYGSYYHSQECDTHYIIGTNLLGQYCATKIHPETLGQYIGRKDKSSIKAYEGDIITVFDNSQKRTFVGTIDFSDCSFMIRQGEFMTHYRWMDYEFTILGNIHKNFDGYVEEENEEE